MNKIDISKPTYNTYQQDTDILEEVVSIKEWLKLMLLMCVPILNIIMLIKLCIGSDNINKNKTTFIRAQLIFSAILLSVMLIMMLVLTVFAVGFVKTIATSPNTSTNIVAESNNDSQKHTSNDANVQINDNTYAIKIPDNYKITDNDPINITAETTNDVIDYMSISDSYVKVNDEEGITDFFQNTLPSGEIIEQSGSNDYKYAISKDSDTSYQVTYVKLIDIGAENYMSIMINAYADKNTYKQLKNADDYEIECADII